MVSSGSSACQQRLVDFRSGPWSPTSDVEVVLSLQQHVLPMWAHEAEPPGRHLHVDSGGGARRDANFGEANEVLLRNRDGPGLADIL